MGMLSEIFSCGGNTGTRPTWRQGRIGSDEFGNRYYEQRGGVGLLAAAPVGHLYDCHGWLHYTFDIPPTEDRYRPRPWEKGPRMNMTGTPEAYRPSGSILGSAERPKATGDYKPWRPQ
jgi:NADH:ubiquinone oxidoreductase subunit